MNHSPSPTISHVSETLRNPVFIDIQCCYDCDYNLFVKELCIRKLGNKFFHHALYDPPQHFLDDHRRYTPSASSQSNKWLTRNFHHFNIYDGFRSYALLPGDVQRVLATNPTIIFVLGSAKIPLIQTLLCGHTKTWEDVDQLYTVDIGVPIVDILTLYDTNGCGEDYIDFQVANIDVLRGRVFLTNNFKPLKKNCPYHFSKHCALDNATVLMDHFTHVTNKQF